MTSEIINLRRVRKDAARREKEQLAEQNRRKFGRSASSRRLDEAQRTRDQQWLDGLKREPVEKFPRD